MKKIIQLFKKLFSRKRIFPTEEELKLFAKKHNENDWTEIPIDPKAEIKLKNKPLKKL